MSIVVDTTASPHARLRPVPVAAVRLEDAFWEPRRGINRTITLPSQYRQCEQTGRIDNFRRAGGLDVPFRGRCYNDSDVYKWLEACAWTLAAGPDPELARMVDTVVEAIAGAQEGDGYLNSYFARERSGLRWSNLRDLHELYCAGHLFQAAVALRRAAGSDRLLAVAARFADLVCAVFGPAGREGTSGHPEIEMALVELYRETGRERYLRQAELFLERRGRRPPLVGGSEYHQDHAPFRSLEGMTGHAVRMLYLCCGAADLCAETGAEGYRAALERLWRSMEERRSYVSGGLGSRYEGEAFGADYELPDDRAYAESCAAIGSVMWCWRMLQLEGEARFADRMEWTLYNAVLPGISLDGREYFYQNPLAAEGDRRRQPWFDCACCPPNIARLLAWLPGCFYSVTPEGAWLHLYAAGAADLRLAGGEIRLRQRTAYPWDGEVEIAVETAAPLRTGLFLRVPGWADGARLQVNGEAPAAPRAGAYARLDREWRSGDVVRLSLPMPARRLECHPRVPGAAGRVALCRGPLLYCLEAADLDGAHPRDVLLPAESELRLVPAPGLPGEVAALQGPALAAPPGSGWEGRLYRPAGQSPAPPSRPILLTAVPYHAWANRGPGAMTVWIREA